MGGERSRGSWLLWGSAVFVGLAALGAGDVLAAVLVGIVVDARTASLGLWAGVLACAAAIALSPVAAWWLVRKAVHAGGGRAVALSVSVLAVGALAAGAWAQADVAAHPLASASGYLQGLLASALAVAAIAALVLGLLAARGTRRREGSASQPGHA